MPIKLAYRPRVAPIGPFVGPELVARRTNGRFLISWLSFAPDLFSPNHTYHGMIPATRRATSGSLTVVNNARGPQVLRNVTRCGKRTGAGGNNVIVAQLGGGRLQQARAISQTSPSRSVLTFALRRDGKEDVVKGETQDEDPLGRPEHAVISTFDLFSIGGPYFYSPSRSLKSPDAALRFFSWSKQFTYRWPNEGWQHFYQRLERFGDPGTSTRYFM